MKLEFGHIEIFVKDPLKSLEFYTNVLGFELMEVQGDKFVWVKMGDRAVLLREGGNDIPAETYQETNITIVIYTYDVEETLRLCKQKGLVIKGDDAAARYSGPDRTGSSL
jgi:catechol 2,3-dioxygenase-like lactoylglutathione lyase family enzyme